MPNPIGEHTVNPFNHPLIAPYAEGIIASQQPTINITLQPSESLSVWQSKVGGVPYLPLHIDYPRGSNGKPLALLAQINFAEIPPLPHFPTQGIMQFYIADNDSWGLNFYDPLDQSNFRVLYFADIITDPQQLQHDFTAYTTFDPCDLPFSGQYAMQFQLSKQYISLGDHRFTLTNPSTGETLNIWDVCELDVDLFDAYQDAFNASGHRIAGYPYFTQYDPRENSEALADYILLLQLDSDEEQGVEMLWGDVGVCNFFIHPEDLKKRDFSKVLYNFDCH